MQKMDENQISGLKTMQLNDQKAGMQGLDKDMINKIIYESSKGTPYFAFQEKRQKSIDSKVAEFHSCLQKISDSEKNASYEKMTKLASLLEFERDLSHSIVHIDMDAFYAAVEMEDNPQLKDTPMAVGSTSMLSTSNYLARKFGVRAAMPGFIAKKLCPDLIIVPCNFDKYRKVSNVVRNIIKEYDSEYSPASLDEVYLDLTEYIKSEHKKQLHKNFCLKDSQNENILNAEIESVNSDEDYINCLNCCQSINIQERDRSAYDIVNEIRDRIHRATNLTASAGIAPNTMLAKVCSDQNKPNGQYQIPSTKDAVYSFISTLPVKKVSGIGPVQGQILNAMGIYTCSDMWSKRDTVGLLFSQTSIDFYMRVAIGIGSTTVKSDYVRKSIGTEHTFKEMNNREELLGKCQELCEEVVDDLIRHKMLGKVVVLKYKTTNFVSHTRNQSLSLYTADKDIIVKNAKKLLEAEIAAASPQPLRLRLMGIRMANLVFEGEVPNIEKHFMKMKDYLKMRKDLPNNSDAYAKDGHNIELSNCTLPNDLSITTKTSTNDTSLIHEASSNRPSETNELEKERTDLSSFTCPVCNFNQNVKNLSELNAHVDSCLNKVAIKEILAGDQVVEGKRKQLPQSPNNKISKKLKIINNSRRIEDYFH